VRSWAGLSAYLAASFHALSAIARVFFSFYCIDGVQMLRYVWVMPQGCALYH
jgi:hypothetical protein